MLRIAERFFQGAKSNGLMAPSSNISLLSSWDDCQSDSLASYSSVLVVASYLFASDSVNYAALRDLANWLNAIRRTSNRPITIFLYLNSPKSPSNAKYDTFKLLCGLDPLASSLRQNEVHYYNKRNSTIASSEAFFHDLLIFKEG